MIATEVNIDRIPQLYRRFVAVFGDVHLRIVAGVKQRIQQNEFLAEYLRDEYEMAYQLAWIDGQLRTFNGRLPLNGLNMRPLQEAAAFMKAVDSLATSWPEDASRVLVRRVHSALDRPDEMRGLRLELAAAVHFTRNRWKVLWAEERKVEGETFDLLVQRAGAPELEVECKSIGQDAGRRVTREEMLEFYSLLHPRLTPLLAGLVRGVAVTVTVPVRLPDRQTEREALAAAIATAVLAGNDNLQDGTTVRLEEFDLGLMGGNPMGLSQKERREAIDRATGTRNRSAVAVGSPAGGLLLITLQSDKDDRMFNAIFDPLSKGARQLTKLRPGFLIAQLQGISASELTELAADDAVHGGPPSRLRVATDKFMRSDARDHVVNMVFFSRTSVRVEGHGVVDSSGGASYSFPRRDSPLWSSHFERVFNEQRASG